MNFRLGNHIKIISILLFSLASCKKSGSLSSSQNIYMTYDDDSLSRAFLWNNGKSTPLTAPNIYSRANAFFVSGNDLYIAGFENDNGNSSSVYWKNGVAYLLPDAAISYYTSIYVSGNDVYLAGGKSVNGMYTATYWKNGLPVVLPLPTGFSLSYLNAIYVSGGDVYVAGNISNNPSTGTPTIATYWKNAVFSVLSNLTTSSNAASIFVSGDDVYVSGYEYSVATYGNSVATFWKNSVPTHLTDSTVASSANSIFVSGSDVYVAGSFLNYYNLQSIATYWKNGLAANLEYSSQPSVAYSIFILGNDVYVSGSVTNESYVAVSPNSTILSSTAVAAFWKNGEATLLTNDQSTPGSIFVK